MLGTPDETIWPGVSQLPDYTSRFPRWEATNIDDVLPTFDDDAKDLLLVRKKPASTPRKRARFCIHICFFMFLENADVRS